MHQTPWQTQIIVGRNPPPGKNVLDPRMWVFLRSAGDARKLVIYIIIHE